MLEELKAIRAKLDEISQRLPVTVAPPAVVVRPGMPPVVKVPAIQLSREEFTNLFVDALEKHGALKFANDLCVETVDLSTDRSTDATIEELSKFKDKNVIALTVFRNTGTFDLYINEKNKDHRLTFDALTYPQTILIDWFNFKTVYVGNAVQSGLEAELIAWKR